MANVRPMYEVIGRAILDRAFRAALLRDPAAATRSAGYNLTQPQLQSLAKLTAIDLQRAMTSLIQNANPDLFAHGDPHVDQPPR